MTEEEENAFLQQRRLRYHGYNSDQDETVDIGGIELYIEDEVMMVQRHHTQTDVIQQTQTNYPFQEDCLIVYRQLTPAEQLHNSPIEMR